MIFWIDQNNFTNQLLEKVFKKAELPLYTLTSVRDFSYLVSDLRPAVIVIDFSTYELDTQAFVKQLESNPDIKKTSFIIIGDGQISGINIVGRLTRPFDPFEIPKKITEILKLQ
jgi:DNA-binding NtrC family response regulator